MIYGFSPATSGTLRVFGLDINQEWREIRSRIRVFTRTTTLTLICPFTKTSRSFLFPLSLVLMRPG